MSWRSGSQMFLEIWPIIKKHIDDEQIRKRFTSDLVGLFSNWDMDPMDLADCNAELDDIIGVTSSDCDDENAVQLCIQDLEAADVQIRKTAAEAIESFVGYAGGAKAQQAAEALVKALNLDQTDCFKIAALESLRTLVWEYGVTVDEATIRRFKKSNHSIVSEKAQYVLNGLHRE